MIRSRSVGGWCSASKRAREKRVKAYTDFTISSSGVANVNVRFVGYEGITTGAQITTKIQKRFLLVFWNDVDGAYWVDNTGSSYFSASHSISVKSGYYRAQVEYVVYVTGGDNNIISEVREAEY